MVVWAGTDPAKAATMKKKVFPVANAKSRAR